MPHGRVPSHMRANCMFVTALVLAGLPGLSAGAAARNKPWDLNVYTHCSEVDLERDDFTGIAYNPKDDLIWAVAPGSNETAIWGFDSAGVVRRSLFSSEQVQLKGVSWLYGDTFALSLPNEQRIAFARISSAGNHLSIRYVPLSHNRIVKQDKITYNAEQKLLLVTDLGDNAPAKDFKTRLSLVMLSGIVRDTTDATLEIEDIADVYYASQPKKLFSLSRNQREAIEVGDDGAVVSRLSLKPHVDEPIAMTFSPDGAKMMVLGSDGDLHIFAAKGCGASQQGMHRRALKQQQVMPGRRVLGIPGGPPAANDGMIGTGLVSSGQNPSSWLAQLSAETAKHADSQNDIYLYYSRLALHNKNYLAMYSLCEAHNITEPTSGRAYSGLAFNDMRKTVWTITGSPPMMAEYNIAGTLERDVSLGSSATSSRPTDITHIGDSLYAILDDNQDFKRVQVKQGHIKIQSLNIQIPQHFKDVNLVGLAWDDETGRFFVAQSRPPAVWSVAEGTPPVLLFTGAELPLEDISGMTHNRQTNSLLLVSSQDRVVVETSLTGELIGTMALASSQAQAGGPLAIAVAGGGKVMFLLSSTGHMEIFSVVQC